MGQALIEAVRADPRFTLSAALDVAGSPAIGRDVGVVIGDDIDAAVKARMKDGRTDIQNGTFAQRFMDDQAAGGPEFKKLRAEGEAHQIEGVGRELRQLMAWVSSEDDYVEGTAAR